MPSLEAMSTESIVSPAAETQNPAADTQKPEVVIPEAEAIAETDDPSNPQEEGTDEVDKTLKRLQRRIDKRTADVYRERARAEQLEQQLAEFRNAKSGEQETPQDSKQDPHAIAKEIAKAERFAERANELVEQGSKKHKDYMQALTALAAEVGPFVVKGLPSPFMEAVLEVAEKPTELMYHLGKNPEVAEELAGLSPLKLAKRLDRIERELADAGKPKQSSAPKPLQEVRGSVSTSKALADLEGKDFMARRREQIANRK